MKLNSRSWDGRRHYLRVSYFILVPIQNIVLMALLFTGSPIFFHSHFILLQNKGEDHRGQDPVLGFGGHPLQANPTFITNFISRFLFVSICPHVPHRSEGATPMMENSNILWSSENPVSDKRKAHMKRNTESGPRPSNKKGVQSHHCTYYSNVVGFNWSDGFHFFAKAIPMYYL